MRLGLPDIRDGFNVKNKLFYGHHTTKNKKIQKFGRQKYSENYFISNNNLEKCFYKSKSQA